MRIKCVYAFDRIRNFILEIYLILFTSFLHSLVGRSVDRSRLPSEFMLFILTFDFITNDNNTCTECEKHKNQEDKKKFIGINDVQVDAEETNRKSHTKRTIGYASVRQFVSESEIMVVFSLNEISDIDDEEFSELETNEAKQRKSNVEQQK